MYPARYLIGLGSNRRHIRYGSPKHVLLAAVQALSAEGDIRIGPLSKIYETPALGPAGRNFANAVVVIETTLSPPEMLKRVKQIEQLFGRRAVRRWGPRVLDLDILLWSGGIWPDRMRWPTARQLVVPHRSMKEREFVLIPAAEIVPNWRDPLSGHTIKQILARFNHTRR